MNEEVRKVDIINEQTGTLEPVEHEQHAIKSERTITSTIITVVIAFIVAMGFISVMVGFAYGAYSSISTDINKVEYVQEQKYICDLKYSIGDTVTIQQPNGTEELVRISGKYMKDVLLDTPITNCIDDLEDETTEMYGRVFGYAGHPYINGEIDYNTVYSFMEDEIIS